MSTQIVTSAILATLWMPRIFGHPFFMRSFVQASTGSTLGILVGDFQATSSDLEIRKNSIENYYFSSVFKRFVIYFDELFLVRQPVFNLCENRLRNLVAGARFELTTFGL